MLSSSIHPGVDVSSKQPATEAWTEKHEMKDETKDTHACHTEVDLDQIAVVSPATAQALDRKNCLVLSLPEIEMIQTYRILIKYLSFFDFAFSLMPILMGKLDGIAFSIIFLLGSMLGMIGSFAMNIHAAIAYVIISMLKCLMAIIIVTITKEKVVPTVIMIIIGVYCTKLAFTYAKLLRGIPETRREVLKGRKYFRVSILAEGEEETEEQKTTHHEFSDVVSMGLIQYK